MVNLEWWREVVIGGKCSIRNGEPVTCHHAAGSGRVCHRRRDPLPACSTAPNQPRVSRNGGSSLVSHACSALMFLAQRWEPDLLR